MSRTDNRVSRKTFDMACDNVYKLKQQNAALLEALRALLENHTQLIASGDCGNWDVETEQEVIQARAAIAAATGEGN